MPKELLKNIIADLKVELLDEFTRNFERKAFFDQPWSARRHSGRGTLMVVTGRLRRSLRASQTASSILFHSDTDYAGIHNTGGTIVVTPKMRKYFWAMYYKSKTNVKKNATAEVWKAMALAQKVKIPKRQFLGNHATVSRAVTEIANRRTGEWLGKTYTDFANKLKH